MKPKVILLTQAPIKGRKCTNSWFLFDLEHKPAQNKEIFYQLQTGNITPPTYLKMCLLRKNDLDTFTCDKNAIWIFARLAQCLFTILDFIKLLGVFLQKVMY